MDYRIEVEDLNVYFDEAHILKDVNIKHKKEYGHFSHRAFRMW